MYKYFDVVVASPSDLMPLLVPIMKPNWILQAVASLCVVASLFLLELVFCCVCVCVCAFVCACVRALLT